MKKVNKGNQVSRDQVRASNAAKRRAKRKSATEELLKPYRNLLAKANEDKLALLKQIADLKRSAATAAPAEVPNAPTE